MPYLEKIFVYPIKSLDGMELREATILESGALQYDREFALVDAENKVINGKRTDRVHLLRSSFDLHNRTVSLSSPQNDQIVSFHLENDMDEIQDWFSEYFTFPIRLLRNAAAGFPDDTNAHGPTIVSRETLETVASWFPGQNVDGMRLRFRTNLEIGDVPPFWEDRLYGEEGTTVRFKIGGVLFEGSNSSQRCAVPPRDPRTGEKIPQFQKIFSQKREETLPVWATRSRFNHFYRLAVNTCVPRSEAGKTIRVGDRIELVD